MTGTHVHVPHVDAFIGQPARHAGAEGILADAADHRDLSAEPLRRHRLVRALATRHREEAIPGNRLARLGEPRRHDDEVHVQAADDGDAGHEGRNTGRPTSGQQGRAARV